MFHPQGPSLLELARQALSSTERGYDLLAEKFDYTPFRTPHGLLDAVVPHIGPDQSLDNGLDVCCGTGAAMRVLRPLCRRRVVGVDFSRRMLEVARQRLASAAGRAQLDFVRADVLQMPFQGEFDVALCFGAVGHIRSRDQSQLVRQVRRALRPGGRFILPSTYRPAVLSRRYWLSRGFNAAMHLRNRLIRPPFVMFYLTFLIPEATELLERHGFRVEVRGDIFPSPVADACLLLATRED